MRKRTILTLLLLIVFLFISYGQSFSQELQWKTVEQNTEQNTPQSLKNLPEWDGIYVVTRTGYIEVSTKKPWTRARFSKGSLFITPHMGFDKSDGETTYVPASEFVGFLVKGRDFIEKLTFAQAEFVKGTIPILTWDEYWISIDTIKGRPTREVPFEKMRRKTVAQETYLIVFDNPVELFGTVEKQKYIAVWLEEKDKIGKVWFVGLQESESSSFGGIQK